MSMCKMTHKQCYKVYSVGAVRVSYMPNIVTPCIFLYFAQISGLLVVLREKDNLRLIEHAQGMVWPFG